MRTRLFSIVVLAAFIPQVAMAQMTSSLNNLINSSGSEFFVGRIEGKPLITVNLLNGVRQPGVYHVPIQTNLGQLIAFAGGTTDTSDISEVTIRSQTSSNTTTKEIDLKTIITHGETIPVLMDKDMIHIRQESRTIEKTLTYVALISASLGIILSAIAIKNAPK
jgi:hypothetical protein